MIATKTSSVLITNADVNQIINIQPKQRNVNTICANIGMIVTNMTATVNALTMARVDAIPVMYWILKLKFVVQLFRNHVKVSMIVMQINSVLIIGANVNQAINTINLIIIVNQNCVDLTAIVIYLIRIVFVLDLNVSVGLDTLWIQILRYVK
jgi:hypothetical protein